ncbi:MAG: Crp/Fnr family transcriptional regulator [Devosia sp.]|uniref:Crp/Fnr family transcriptional regulator n=1 Tax=Devosia sp. TaxID=1871048 RepID=UPI002619534F|nr:Crp/Fnr family transcriptional regulator [Devosia sp.]MDB5538497.1 Crp/Fnr family transcriptional regulator [Devosia sp.]
MNANVPPTAALVAKLTARDDLSAEEIAVLQGMMSEPRIVQGGHDIVRDGDRPGHSTLLIDGFACRYTTLKDGGRQITALHVAGDFVDLHSFMLKEMDHGVGALTLCRIATVDHGRLLEITHTHPHLTRMFWLLTLIDGSMHREWLVGMGRRPALGNAAHFICEIYTRLSVVGMAADNAFVLPLTQVELGDVLGLSSVHVNRVLQELRSGELITWTGQNVVILDWDALADLAEFDPRYLHVVKEPR